MHSRLDITRHEHRQTHATLELRHAAAAHIVSARGSIQHGVGLQPMEDGSLTEGSGRCAFELLGPQLLPGQRYMVDRLEDKASC